MNNLFFQKDVLQHEVILLLRMPKNQLLPLGSLNTFLILTIVQASSKQQNHQNALYILSNSAEIRLQ